MIKLWTLGLVASLAACGGGGHGGDDDGGGDDGVPTGTALALDNPDGSFYVADLTIGTQTFKLDIDTGSTTTAVAGASCTTCTALSPLYNPSGTATDTGKKVSTQYADGSGWMGEVWADGATLGGGTPTVSTKFAEITEEDMFFFDNAYQGILGLGPLELAETGTSAFFEDVVAGGADPFLGFEMCDLDGTMWVGGYDKAATASPMQYSPMLPISKVDNPFYSINISDVGFDNVSLGVPASAYAETVDFGGGDTAVFYPIVDTGTTLTYIPTAAYNKLLTQLEAHPMYDSLFASKFSASQDGCVNAKSGATGDMVDAALPEMSVTFPNESGESFTISASAVHSYIFDVGGGQFCLAVGDDGGEGVILGDTFMRGFVTVFDIDQLAIGFAPDAGCDDSAKPRAKRTAGKKLVEHGRNPHGRFLQMQAARAGL